MNKGLRELYNRIFGSWKSTLMGLLVLMFTVLVFMGRVSPELYLSAFGGIIGFRKLFAKDSDKEDS